MNTRYLFRYACIAVILTLCSGVFAAGMAPAGGTVKINPKDGAVMVWVPAGWFIMGSSAKEIVASIRKYSVPEKFKMVFESQGPQHKVYLNGYWIYKYEVTVAQYRRFCKDTRRRMPDAPVWGWKDNYPMLNVTWNDADAYVRWAVCSLPTEAQWEKAARGADGRTYPWGTKWDPSKCTNSIVKKRSSPETVGSHPAGASPFGCQDMAGNAWEWCADWYDPDYYKSALSRNPTGPVKAVEFEFQFQTTSISSARVLRGGSWRSGSDDGFQCYSRSFGSPSFRYDIYGFRCVMKP